MDPEGHIAKSHSWSHCQRMSHALNCMNLGTFAVDLVSQPQLILSITSL